VELDLKEESGRARVTELAAQADVLVEGFRPGVLARFGLDEATVRERNAGIVDCSISGYGQHDPRATLPGHDVNYQAWSGSLAPEGGRATIIPPLPTADLAAGMTAAFGICAAMLGRASTGRGAYLDVSMTDVLSTWTGPAGAADAARHEGPPAPTPGYGLFATADGGQVALGVLNEQHFWSSLCEELALGELAGLGFEERRKRGAELQQTVGAAVARCPRDELVQRLADAGVPVAPVLDRQGMLAAAPFPAFPIRLPLPPVARRAPALDEHHGQGFDGSG
jgi:crotonobetainyl-CoA:carnitine CoA-transferase CaiB-like acyl-CoA transferase